ncbi:MAG: hypothetical protein IKP68_07515, partial [Clostridia bacterium]|nr:hypothetical protein [Clostridia bacterium]
MKRIISAVLVVLFLLSLMPVGILAVPHWEDWERNFNYLYYMGNDGTKKSGYMLDIIIVTLTDDFDAEHEALSPEDFGEAASAIKLVKIQPDKKTCYIYLYETEYAKSNNGSP